MKKPTNTLLPGILVFAVGILAAFFSQLYPDTKILIRITFIIAIIYLSLGWYIFKSYIPEAESPLLFLMGYLYSSIFIASVFSTTGWPLASTIISLSIVWIIAQVILIIALRKKMTKEALTQFIIETGFLLILDIFILTGA